MLVSNSRYDAARRWYLCCRRAPHEGRVSVAAGPTDSSSLLGLACWGRGVGSKAVDGGTIVASERGVVVVDPVLGVRLGSDAPTYIIG